MEECATTVWMMIAWWISNNWTWDQNFEEEDFDNNEIIQFRYNDLWYALQYDLVGFITSNNNNSRWWVDGDDAEAHLKLWVNSSIRTTMMLD